MLSDDVEKFTGNILWRVYDVLELSDDFKSRLVDTNCEIDPFRPMCEICQLENILQNQSDNFGRNIEKIYVLQFSNVNFEIANIHFQMEFWSNDNKVEEIKNVYQTWLKNIVKNDFLSGSQTSSDGYIGVLRFPSEIFSTTWSRVVKMRYPGYAKIFKIIIFSTNYAKI